MFTSTDQLRLITLACDPMIGFANPYDDDDQDMGDLPQIIQFHSVVETFETYSRHCDALAAGIPSPVSPIPRPGSDQESIWQAAAWLSTSSCHPLMPVFEDVLDSGHCFVMLGRQVLQRSAGRDHVRLPGISGDLYVLREVTSDLTDPGPSSSGLLAAMIDPSPVSGLDTLRILMWSMSDTEVDALLRDLS